ncbi:MAG: hypothetical protein GEV10_27680 [Streptosporangiales bacterium]|nr:hypothetical protein [Streptosporangiales bacterium]
MMYGYGMGAWGYVLMSLSMIVFWGLLIAGVVALWRFLRRAPRDASTKAAATPEQILAERYARGEIDEDEYLHRQAGLRP